ncbi:PIN domain-containing protein [Conexibacter sp. S30A1]|uniref:PIN domain-containing protein n=1 Tax=Conexibacter sp. S30A1 TaxID=2937800 RepID=UPI0020109ED9|nr:PIN domain-containing protein [Conexibacter sp. S30A1]
MSLRDDYAPTISPGPYPRLRLKPRTSAAQTIASLEQLINKARDITSHADGPADVVVDRLRNGYADWVEQVEDVLHSATYWTDWSSLLFTDRYWHIRDMASAVSRPHPLVDHEIRRQTAWLQGAVDDLKSRVARADLATGAPAVVDTNVLLHFMPLDQIPWPEVVGMREVRLILPLRVVEELDSKKYDQSKLAAKRARSILPRIEELVGPAGEPGNVRENVTLEVLVDAGPRFRSGDADDEILSVTQELPLIYGAQTCLITGDTGMKLRAHARRIPIVSLPDQYRRQGDSV